MRVIGMALFSSYGDQATAADTRRERSPRT
jgi:hypothetical protein